MLKANPVIIFIKSEINIGKTIFILFLGLKLRYTASSLPHNRPTKTHVVDIGISLYSLKYRRIIAYAKSIIVADLTNLTPDFDNMMSCIFPPLL